MPPRCVVIKQHSLEPLIFREPLTENSALVSLPPQHTPQRHCQKESIDDPRETYRYENTRPATYDHYTAYYDAPN